MKDTKHTLLKQNPIIKSIANAVNGVSYKEVHHDLLNCIMFAIQKSIEINGANEAFNAIIIKEEDIKKYTKITKATDNFIFKSLTELMHITYELTEKDLKKYSTILGINVVASKISFITEVTKIKDDIDKRVVKYKIKFNNTFFLPILDTDFNISYGNYTPLNLGNVSQINSKHGKKLYELLMSRKKMGSFSLSLDELRRFFGKDNYSMSDFKAMIERGSKKVQLLIPFTIEVHKKDKKISFYYT